MLTQKGVWWYASNTYFIQCMMHAMHHAYDEWCRQCNIQTSIGYSVKVTYNSKLCHSVINGYHSLDVIVHFFDNEKRSSFLIMKFSATAQWSLLYWS